MASTTACASWIAGVRAGRWAERRLVASPPLWELPSATTTRFGDSCAAGENAATCGGACNTRVKANILFFFVKMSDLGESFQVPRAPSISIYQ